MTTLIVDCGTCVVRGAACADCVMTALMGEPEASPVLGDEERRALGVLADSGLLPRLRLVQDLSVSQESPEFPEKIRQERGA